MSCQSGILAGMLETHGKRWHRLLWILMPFILAFACLLVLEGMAISKMDWWLPVESMDTADRYSVMISAGSLWLRICLIGAGIYYALKVWPTEASDPVGPQFLVFWCLISLALVWSLLTVDLWRHDLQYGEGQRTGESFRGLWLASIYGKIFLFYLAARFLFGATRVGRGGHSWTQAWSAATARESFGFFLALFVLKLTIENVFVTVLSFVPLISPFWFIPNELATSRFFVAQGTRIVAESIGLLFYVSFWMAVDQQLVREQTIRDVD